MSDNLRNDPVRLVRLLFVGSLFAWVIWGPQALHRYGLLGWAPSLQSPLNALTVWSPGLAAIILTGRALGKAAIGDLFRQFLVWRVPLVWYALALLLEPARWAVAFGIDRLLGRAYALGPIPLAAHLGAAAPFMIPVALVFTMPNSLGEELGWRAFALPRLSGRYGPLCASIILGLFWGFWHLPMWFAWASSTPGILSILLMIANFVPTALLFTWIYFKAGRSLLLAVLFHASSAGKQYLCPKLPTLTEIVLLWLVALAVVLLGGLRTQSGGGDADN